MSCETVKDDFRAELQSTNYRCKEVLDRRITYKAKFTGICGRPREGLCAVRLLAFMFFVPQLLVTMKKSDQLS